MKLFT